MENDVATLEMALNDAVRFETNVWYLNPLAGILLMPFFFFSAGASLQLVRASSASYPSSKTAKGCDLTLLLERSNAAEARRVSVCLDTDRVLG